jgi:hypothetical protein
MRQDIGLDVMALMVISGEGRLQACNNRMMADGFIKFIGITPFDVSTKSRILISYIW